MFELILTGVVLVVLSIAVHAIGTLRWLRFLGRHYIGANGDIGAKRALPALTWTALVLFLLHMLEVVIWATAYLLLVPSDQLTRFEEAVYFSIVTFTTVGYGDITIAEYEWRLLSGIEGLTGIVLVGWTTALLFAVFQRCWRGLVHGHQHEHSQQDD